MFHAHTRLALLLTPDDMQPFLTRTERRQLQLFGEERQKKLSKFANLCGEKPGNVPVDKSERMYYLCSHRHQSVLRYLL